MIQTHYIKIHKNFADAVYHGFKTFEIRKNDRGYQAGDRVIFRVIGDNGVDAIAHPLSREAYRITYLLHGYGLQDGYCVFGIAPWTDREDMGEEDGET